MLFRVMLFRRLQIPIWKQASPTESGPVSSQLLLKRCLNQDSGGAVGLGIVTTLSNSSKSSSPVFSRLPTFTMADFLSHCCLCKKGLQGEDMYMYQDKAFCSIECRYRKMVSDEIQGKRRRFKMPKILDIPCSPCSSGGRLFFTGITAV